MPATANTWRLISSRVGEKGSMFGDDVTTVQQLLVAAGNNDPSILGGGWGGHSKDALLAFQKAHRLPVLISIPLVVCMPAAGAARDVGGQYAPSMVLR